VDDGKRTYVQVTQKMKVLKNWKRADARWCSFTWMTSWDPGHRDPRWYSRELPAKLHQK